MKLSPKTKKRILILLPLLLIGGGVYWYYRSSRPVGFPVTSTGSAAPPLKTSPTPTNSAFPLKKGSNNSYVKKLQTALGISADGIFGSQTEAALSSAAGITVIQNETQLNEVINKITKGIADVSRGTSLVNEFKKGGKNILCIKDVFVYQVIKDYAGALTQTGIGIQFYKNKVYSNADYLLTGVTKLGKLEITVNKGTLMGLYTCDPASISLINV